MEIWQLTAGVVDVLTTVIIPSILRPTYRAVGEYDSKIDLLDLPKVFLDSGSVSWSLSCPRIR
jgi:hypothetical protein